MQELGILFQESIFFVKDLKSPKKSGRFDTSGSSVAHFVPEIAGGTLSVTEEKKEKKEKDSDWGII